jgi:hypothetical protein
MTIRMKRYRPTLDSVHIIPTIPCSALFAACEADPAAVTRLDLAAAEMVLKVQRGLAKCYVCAQPVGLRARITICQCPSGFTFMATCCKRCRKKMDRDEKFGAAVHVRIELDATALDRGASGPAQGSA